MKRATLLLVALALLALSGCDGDAQAEGCDLPQADAAAATAKPTELAGTLARIVFVDQEEACGCTMDRIQATWEALDQALLEHPDVPVERIHGDTQEELAAPYLAMKALVVAPGVYFLDGEGKLLDQLQGELTAEELGRLVK